MKSKKKQKKKQQTETHTKKVKFKYKTFQVKINFKKLALRKKKKKIHTSLKYFEMSYQDKLLEHSWKPTYNPNNLRIELVLLKRSNFLLNLLPNCKKVAFKISSKEFTKK